jgi:homoserine kinase type II
MPRYGIPDDVERAMPVFLDHWGIQPLAVEEIEEGYENLNILVTSADGACVVRRYSFREDDEIPFEIEILRACAERGVPVAAPLPDRSSNYVNELAGRPASVFEFVEGSHPREGSLGDRRRVGAWIAEFHQAMVGYRPEAAKAYDDFTELERVERLRSEFATHGYSEFLSDLDDFRVTYLPELVAVWDELPHGVVHGDFYAGNLLVRDGGLVALLDFDTAFYGALVRDIADAILCWSDRHPEFEPDGSAAVEILEGYERVRPLDRHERSALASTLLLACLSDAIRTISVRMQTGRPFTSDRECHMYRRYLRLLEARTRR